MYSHSQTRNASQFGGYEGFEGFANLDNLEGFEDLVFRDFPASFGSPSGGGGEQHQKAFQILDQKSTIDFFGADSLFAGPSYQTVLDDIEANVCLLDENGLIIYTNKAWRRFSEVNGGTSDRTDLGVNYLELCRTCTGDFVDNAQFFAEGLARSISGRTIGEFCFEYPCDSATLARWFTAKVFTFHLGSKKITVVAHERQSEKPKVVAAPAATRRVEQPMATSCTTSTKPPLVLLQDPLVHASKDFLNQFKVQTPNWHYSGPRQREELDREGRKKRKTSATQNCSDSKLVFVSRGGPPTTVDSKDKIEIQREISFTESYLVTLRRKLLSVAESSEAPGPPTV